MIDHVLDATNCVARKTISNTHPFGNPSLRTDGKTAPYDGSPTSRAAVEGLWRAWLEADHIAEQGRITAKCRMQLSQNVRFIRMAGPRNPRDQTGPYVLFLQGRDDPAQSGDALDGADISKMRPRVERGLGQPTRHAAE